MSQYCVQLQLKSILIEERLSYDLIIAGLLQWLFVTETPVAIGYLQSNGSCHGHEAEANLLVILQSAL